MSIRARQQAKKIRQRDAANPDDIFYDDRKTEFRVKNGIIEMFADRTGSFNSYSELTVQGRWSKTIEERITGPLARGEESRVSFRYMHKKPIGYAIHAEDQEEGLLFVGKVSERSAQGKEAIILVEDKAITGSSVGFWPGERDNIYMTDQELEELLVRGIVPPEGSWWWPVWMRGDSTLLENSLVDIPSQDGARVNYNPDDALEELKRDVRWHVAGRQKKGWRESMKRYEEVFRRADRQRRVRSIKPGLITGVKDRQGLGFVEVGDFIMWGATINTYGQMTGRIESPVDGIPTTEGASEDNPFVVAQIWNEETDDQWNPTQAFSYVNESVVTRIDPLPGSPEYIALVEEQEIADAQALLSEFEVGNLVVWTSNTGVNRGQIEEIVETGTVPGLSFIFEASETKPAARVELYSTVSGEDGQYEPSGIKGAAYLEDLTIVSEFSPDDDLRSVDTMNEDTAKALIKSLDRLSDAFERQEERLAGVDERETSGNTQGGGSNVAQKPEVSPEPPTSEKRGADDAGMAELEELFKDVEVNFASTK